VQYRPADLSSFSPNSTRFYSEDYHPVLRGMVAAVIEAEGPIFEAVLACQVAKAHGFGRVGRQIQEIAKSAIDVTVLRTDEGTLTILWPKDANPDRPIDFRWAALDTRHCPTWLDWRALTWPERQAGKKYCCACGRRSV
jgi:Protein of unknown function (DUF3320)